MSNESNIVIVTGSRDLEGRKPVFKLLDKMTESMKVAEVRVCPEIDISMHASEWAEVKDIPAKEFKINWKDVKVEGAEVVDGEYGPYNRRAPLMRNNEMLKDATHLIAITDGSDRNVQSLFDYAKRRGLAVRMFILSNGELTKAEGTVQEKKPEPKPEPKEESVSSDGDWSTDAF